MIHNVWYHWEQHREDGTLEIQLFLHSGYADVTIDCINRVNQSMWMRYCQWWNQRVNPAEHPQAQWECIITGCIESHVMNPWNLMQSRRDFRTELLNDWMLKFWSLRRKKRDWAYFNDNENMRKSASFTGLKVSCPVDACLNRNCVKCHFWCVAHKTRKIAVRIEISVFTLFSSFVFSTSVPRAWKFQHMRTLKYEFSIQVLTVNSFDAIFSES